jgi:hypothetical protein
VILAVMFMYIRVYLFYIAMSANMTVAINSVVPKSSLYEQHVPGLEEAALSLDSLLIFSLNDSRSLDRPRLKKIEAFAALYAR